MAQLTLGGATHVIAPFRLRELRLAAPHIDRLAARTGKLDSVAAVAETAADMLAVLAVGLGDASLERLQAQVSLEDMDALRQCFDAVMIEAGLKRPAGAASEALPSEHAASGEALGAGAAAP